MTWAEPAAAIERLVRATNPWNRGALTFLRGQPLRLLSVLPHPNAATGPVAPGTVLHADLTTRLWVACGAGEALRLDIVTLEGYFTGNQLVQLGIQPGKLLNEMSVK